METKGQKRVVLTYSVPTQEQKDLANDIKLKTSELIDMLEILKKDAHDLPEKIRLVSLAQTEFEAGSMWAVKAVFNG